MYAWLMKKCRPKLTVHYISHVLLHLAEVYVWHWGGLYTCIPVRGRIKETARVDNLVIPQRAGWITSYPPVVNCYMIQTLNTKL